MSKVEVRNLTKSFGDLLVLDNVSFDVASGEFLCIVGPTGCGKTTFLNSLVKIYDIDDGSIKIDGEEVDLRRHSLAYIMQEYSTMSWLTVRQNVQYGLKIKRLKKAEMEAKTDAALELVGLEKFRDYYPNQLSASMMQRVAIARAFAVEPHLLLMDEPYGQLDLELRFKLEDELLALWRKLGTTIIFITHNIEEAVYLSQRILVLTNKPTTIKESIENPLPFPRKVVADDFIALRNRVTDLIKWW
ncbi:MAG: ABC transporter ATP-binding protein [Planctomycetaceae bacterium]|nr:ABC transporter ATP-binding protein [Planctomycetaceae bacterium]